ncbi:MAG: alpha/beta hydrolase [Gammaproteobacteria bacterium HGW-Gammaproteobacteria-6]|nr:MAG: alpha/beta hydrolase [Gammaproteobacteria bacterium HGW-Gammaproteobacteria-6]
MHYQNRWLTTPDERKILMHQWQPVSEAPRALVMISHGMAEHAQRYARLAEQLCARGMLVTALDQRGHGATGLQDRCGHFADQDGWSKVCSDIGLLLTASQRLAPRCKVILLGHSMGSYIAQGYILDNSQSIDLLILSGSNAHPPALSQVGRLAARIEGAIRGQAVPALSLNRLSFGQFNNAFKPTRTEFDWLSRDPAEVDAYIADPLCGFAVSAGLWQDLFQGLLAIARQDNLARIRSNLPVLIIGGSADPVSAGNGLHRLQQRLRSAGLTEVKLQLYDGARHEVFNETNHEQVVNDLLEWLNQHLDLTLEPEHV